MLRRYWTPALLSVELADSGSPPVRVELLGETFVAFRDDTGRVGILDEACPHRCTSLVLGRVEDDGLRCIYHGWKFSVDGDVLDTPNWKTSRVKDSFRAHAYPTREAAGIIWVYLGPPDKEPAFPAYQLFDFPEDEVQTLRFVANSNYVQIMEANLDSSHVGILHSDSMPFGTKSAAGEGMAERLFNAGEQDWETTDLAPVIEVQNTDSGFQFAALREAVTRSQTGYYTRTFSYVVPYLTVIPRGAWAFVVPVDDCRTHYFMVYAGSDIMSVEDVLKFQGFDRATGNATQGSHSAVAYVAPKPEERWRQDRDRMGGVMGASFDPEQGESYSGIEGVLMEDFAISAAMGTVVDRAKEHLVPADIGVIRMRRVLLDAIASVENGGDPVGVDATSSSTVSAADGFLPVDTPWQTLAPHHVVTEKQVRRRRESPGKERVRG